MGFLVPIAGSGRCPLLKHPEITAFPLPVYASSAYPLSHSPCFCLSPHHYMESTSVSAQNFSGINITLYEKVLLACRCNCIDHVTARSLGTNHNFAVKSSIEMIFIFLIKNYKYNFLDGEEILI